METPTSPVLQSVEQVSDGWIKKYVLTYQLPNGTTHRYESASRKGMEVYRAGLTSNEAGSVPAADAVCIVPETPDGKLVLIREFRYPLNAWCVAFPAGLVDEGEDIAKTCDRELREETGYAVRTDVERPLRLLAQPGFSSTGLTDETIQVVFAQVERVGEPSPEGSELIRPFLLDKGEVAHFLETDTSLIGTRAQLILELYAH